MEAPREDLIRQAPAWSLAVLILLVGIVVWRSMPPAAELRTDVDPRVFSAGRALATIRALDPHDTPQPVGSAAHAAVRQRLITQLDALGLSPEVQTAWSCRPGAVCALVRNVVTRIDGRRDAPAVMVSAHYDTVHAAPGAGDDMHGIAILVETARALTHGDPPRNPVILLATDAEEPGLLGARAFVEGHPWASEVAVAVNVDARGTRGRSNMFETSRGNAPLVELYARAVPSSSATSLADEVYRRMPNDTDFTVFERAGMRGLNFAFIGGVEHYHTELDRLEHLSPRSVQHQGESVLATTLALAEADLDAIDGPQAAYTDVLRALMVRWPAAAGLPVLAILGLALLASCVWLRARGLVTLRGCVVGALLALLLLVLVPAAAHGVDWSITTLAGHPTPWNAHPLPHRIALWAVAVGLSVVVGGIVGRRCGAWALACGGGVLLSALGVVAVAFVPGISPQFVLPAGAAAIAAWAAGVRPSRRRATIIALLSLTVTGVVWLPLALALEEAFGFAIPAATTLPLAVVAVAWVPLLADGSAPVSWIRRLAAASFAVLVLAIVVAAWVVEPYSPTRPRRLNVLHHTDADRGEAFVVVGPGTEPPPQAMLRRAAFEDGPRTPLPWSVEPYWVAAAEPVPERPPAVELLEVHDDARQRRARLRIASQRGADRLMVLLDQGAEVDWIELEGQRLERAELPARWRGRRGVVVFGMPPEGIHVEIALPTGARSELELIDLGVSMPEATRPLVDARGERATQSQWGDATSISRRLEL